MEAGVLSALDGVRRAGVALFGIGSVLFFSWFLLSINITDSRAGLEFIHTLEGAGFLYVVLAVGIGLLLAVFYLYLFMTYYSRRHPDPIKVRFKRAALCLFGNIPVAYAYFAVFSSMKFPGGD